MTQQQEPRPWPKVRGTWMRIQRVFYWMGLRPKRGSILCSPSLVLVYGFYDARRAEFRRDFRTKTANPYREVQ